MYLGVRARRLLLPSTLRHSLEQAKVMKRPRRLAGLKGLDAV